MSSTHGLTLKERWGICFGTIYFLLMLPITVFMSAIPTTIIMDAVSNKVLALTMNMVILSVGMLISLLAALVTGLMTSYGFDWAGKKLGYHHAFLHKSTHHKPIESGKKINLGAFLGGVIALIYFFISGMAPINTVIQKVEHLFPAPLLMSMGNLKVNVSEVYSSVVGFLAVSFLYVIIGVTAGSLIFAIGEKMFHGRRSHSHDQ